MLKQPDFFCSQPFALPKDAPEKFYLSATFGIRLMIRSVPLPDRGLLMHI